MLVLCLLMQYLLVPQTALASNSAVILQYHHFSDQTPPSTSISPSLFEQHLEYLAAEDFTVMTLDTIMVYLRDNRDLPQKCVAITIDDAYRSVYDTAWPLLEKRNWSCTTFVTSQGVDDHLESYLTWDQMRELAAAGMEFGNHSHSHDYLIQMKPAETPAQWRQRIRTDITTCQERLKEELGIEASSFVYPFGEYNSDLKEIVGELGLIGVGQQSGCLWAGSDFALIPRYPMSGSFGKMADFQLKVWTLPLPVIEEIPDDPIILSRSKAPTLRLRLAPGDYQLTGLACYASHEGQLDVIWVDREALILEVTANSPLPSGRSRYNLSAPHEDGGRYFWYSHLWIRP